VEYYLVVNTPLDDLLKEFGKKSHKKNKLEKWVAAACTGQ
jgi:hypothetical protein